ncbi:MAG: MobA/MobL family protein [Oscillospiraceae bacterium]|nr:MobA/MobL family protein [Oscillospiraceae bacterium]
MSRGKNASAVAKAAYISGEKIKNSYDGVTHDYRKKKEIVHKEILLPSDAPPEFMNRSVLWNAVEQSEKRKNSQTTKHIDAALPVEISRAEQIDLVRNFCLQCFVSRGMCADFAIHDKGDGNPHVHILLTTRRVDKNGFTVKDRSWNDKSLLLEWRKLWADWCNHKLYSVSDERIDHRSYAAQGIDKIPQVHLGAAACAIEKKGYRTDKGSRNRRIALRNLDMEIEKQKRELNDICSERIQLRTNYLETIVGCQYCEMQKLEGDISHLKDFEIELRKRNVQCHIMGMFNGTGAIFFPKADYDKAVEALNAVEKRTNPITAPPEQKRDEPVKKRRSR